MAGTVLSGSTSRVRLGPWEFGVPVGITKVMQEQGCHIFAYIDDFVIVSNADDPEHHFQALSSLFNELELPTNPEKCKPPCRALSCLGIHIDIDNILSIDKAKMQEIHRSA